MIQQNNYHYHLRHIIIIIINIIIIVVIVNIPIPLRSNGIIEEVRERPTRAREFEVQRILDSLDEIWEGPCHGPPVRVLHRPAGVPQPRVGDCGRVRDAGHRIPAEGRRAEPDEERPGEVPAEEHLGLLLRDVAKEVPLAQDLGRDDDDAAGVLGDVAEPGDGLAELLGDDLPALLVGDERLEAAEVPGDGDALGGLRGHHVLDGEAIGDDGELVAEVVDELAPGDPGGGPAEGLQPPVARPHRGYLQLVDGVVELVHDGLEIRPLPLIPVPARLNEPGKSGMSPRRDIRPNPSEDTLTKLYIKR